MPEDILAIVVSTILAIAVVSSAIAQETGTIAGRVLNAGNGRPVRGASAAVDGIVDARDTTDRDGYFSISGVPVGAHTVRVAATGYGASRVTDVEVRSGEETRINTALSPQSSEDVEVLEVTADVTEASEATQLLKRKMAPTVSDNLGSETISKTPDSDAAEVVTRVPAVTIKDGKFIVVRGLNERYSSALLNRSRLPSPDPNRRVIPLDLFPADFIESLSVIKSYTPNLPGDFAGGLVDIELAPPPGEFEGGLGVSTSFNTVTTFQDFDTYDGTTLDWFTFGDGYRGIDIRSRPDFSTTPRMQAFVGSIPNNWNIDTVTAPPNFGIDGHLGGPIGPVKTFLSFIYNTKHRVHRNEWISTYFRDTGSTSLRPVESFAPTAECRSAGFDCGYDRSIFEANLGAVMTSELDVTKNHKLSLRGLFNRKSTDEVLDGTGFDFNEESIPLRATSQIYTADQLGYGQLQGRHNFEWIDVDWRAGAGLSTREQPDAKFVVRELQELDDGSSAFLLDNNNNSLVRVFGSLDEVLQDYALDFSIPFTSDVAAVGWLDGLPGIVQLGVAYTNRDRDFRQVRLDSGDSLSRLSASQRAADAESLLRPENYQLGSGLEMKNATKADDSRFLASHEIAGGYGMLDLSLVPDRLRFIGGSRVEYSYIHASGATIFDGPFVRIINDLEPLPAANLIWNATDSMNVRGAYSRTVSRPELRELTPAIFPSAPGERPFQGNPNLESTGIDNYDLRWEWFFSPLELASLSVFYKEIESPIEITVIPAASSIRDSVVNTEGATAWGFEGELRKDFNFLVPLLREYGALRRIAPIFADIQLTTNLSWVESESEAPKALEGRIISPTNPVRQLQGQAPFTVNASVQYEHYRWGTFRLLYNTVGKTLDAVGLDPDGADPANQGQPDIFVQRRDQLDFVWVIELNPWQRPVRFKFAAENLTNDDFVEIQGTDVTNRYFDGVSFGLGLSTSF
jgi:hypothetical protein